MRITLNGTLGSGKSTVGRELARRLGVRYISTGQIFRQLGHIANLDALQTNLEAESNRALDDQVDSIVRGLNETERDFVIDSRMAWHFVDGALKVFLCVTPETAARRVMSDTTRVTESYSSLENALAALRARRDSELRRYQRLYGVDIEAPHYYDMRVITDDAEAGDAADLILRRARGETRHANWIPKSRIVPLIPPATGGGAATADELPLPLQVAENFGFYSGDPAQLVRALSSGGSFVPYTEQQPDGDVMARAFDTVRPQDLRAWEHLAGVPFAFRQKLAG